MSLSVVLCTYNGTRYIEEQLESILSQSLTPDEIVVSDDGSSDDVLEVIDSRLAGGSVAYSVLKNKFTIGPALNFSQAINQAKGEYIAMSDQDDVWGCLKLESLMSLMHCLEADVGCETPILVFSDATIVDSHLNVLHSSFQSYHGFDLSRVSLASLLVENISPGCCMLVNKALAELAMPLPEDALMHDGWLMLVAKAFGKIGYVDQPLVKYRQHDRNAVGASRKLGALKILRSIAASKRVIIGYQSQARAFLTVFGGRLSPQDFKLMSQFSLLSEKNFWARKVFCLKNKIKKQSPVKNIALYCFV